MDHESFLFYSESNHLILISIDMVVMDNGLKSVGSQVNTRNKVKQSRNSF
jgi:hypothetical protein